MVIFDLSIGFLVKHCAYSQLEMSRIPNFAQKIMNIIVLYDFCEYEVWVSLFGKFVH